MPTGPIDDQRSVLYFTDISGSNNYTTLIVFHGSAFTEDTFRKLLPLAAKSNIRLVILNRRHYSGSTRYTELELEELRSGRKEFLERLGLEVVHFLIWFAEEHDIPKINADQKSGGIATMGWSLGTSTILAALGHPDVIPKDSFEKLESYLREIIIYDSPHLALGYEQPQGYHPFTDPELKTPEEVSAHFIAWISSYFDHPDINSRSVTTGLDFSRHGAHPSIKNMTPEEMKTLYDGEASDAMEFPMCISPMQSTLKEQAEVALFDEKYAQTILPNLKIVWLCCTRSNWCCVYGFFHTEKLYKEHLAQGHKVRPIRFIEVEGAKHFAHWDIPDVFFAATADAVHD